MSQIPNVSFVMREVAGLSFEVDSMLRKADQRSHPVPTNILRQQLHPTPVDRGEKHRQLMQRMRSSVKQARQMIFGEEVPFQMPKFNIQTYTTDSVKSSKTFVMPQINYRHVKDAQQSHRTPLAQTAQTSQPALKTNQLEREFYETEEKGVRKAPQEQQLSQGRPLSSMGGTAKSNFQPSTTNHEDLLQRYYDILTRKRRAVPTSSVDQQSSRRGYDSKFKRSQPSDDVGIQKAMRTLLNR